jgi:hypothetical protein
MQRILDWWTAYHDWASHLDSQGRFWIIVGCLLLLTVYATIHVSPVDSSKVSPKSVKATKSSQKDRSR